MRNGKPRPKGYMRKQRKTAKILSFTWWESTMEWSKELGTVYQPKGADYVIHGNIPIGAGTSSSAGLSVAAVDAISDVFKLGIEDDPEEWLTVAQFGESITANKILRRVTGRLDQGTSIRGKIGYLLLNNFSPDGGGELIPLNLPSTHQMVVGPEIAARFWATRCSVTRCCR